jgi:hypothetical protein
VTSSIKNHKYQTIIHPSACPQCVAFPNLVVHLSAIVLFTFVHSCVAISPTVVHGCEVVTPIGVHPMCACMSNPCTHVHNCYLHSHTLCVGFPNTVVHPECATVLEKHAHNVWETEFYPCTHAWVFPLFSRTSGALPLKTHVRPFVQALPNSYQLHKMQNDRVTNLSLPTPESVASLSRNLKITS